MRAIAWPLRRWLALPRCCAPVSSGRKFSTHDSTAAGVVSRAYFDGHSKHVWVPTHTPIRVRALSAWMPPCVLTMPGCGQGLVVHSHGLNDHSRMLESFLPSFTSQGFAVASLDATGAVCSASGVRDKDMLMRCVWCCAPGHGETAMQSGTHGFFEDAAEMSADLRGACIFLRTESLLIRLLLTVGVVCLRRARVGHLFRCSFHAGGTGRGRTCH